MLQPSAVAAPEAPPYPGAAGGEPGAYKDTGWYRQCMALKHLRPAPGRLAAKTETCDATSLYYDKLNQAQVTAAEWEPVRQCAAASRDDGVLMMLYANARGRFVAARDKHDTVSINTLLTQRRTRQLAKLGRWAVQG
jgi:hypothetical protein